MAKKLQSERIFGSFGDTRAQAAAERDAYFAARPAYLARFVADASLSVTLRFDTSGTAVQTLSEGVWAGDGSDASKDYVDNLDSNNVKLTGDQTVFGFKVFDATFIGVGGLAVGDRGLTNVTNVGSSAGLGNTQLSQTAIGTSAGQNNTGTFQTAVGLNAGKDNTGIDQTALGTSAGQGNTGSNQTAVGRSAGRDNTFNNTLVLGGTAGLPYNNATKDNQAVIGNDAITETLMRGTVTSDTSTGALKLPVGTTAQRPASPVEGMARVNSTTSAIEVYVNGGWA